MTPKDNFCTTVNFLFRKLLKIYWPEIMDEIDYPSIFFKVADVI